MQSKILTIGYISQQPRWDFHYFDDKYLQIEKLLDQGKYPIEPLANYTKQIVNFGAYSLCNLLVWVNDGIPYLRVTDLKEDGISWSNVPRIPHEIHIKLPKSKVYPGDVLYSMAGTIGLSIVAPEEIGECNSNQAIAKIRLKSDRLNPYYLATFLNSQLGRYQSERIANGQTVFNINMGEIGLLRIPLPPRSIQDRIAQIMLNAYFVRKKLLNKAKDLNIEIKNYIFEILGISQNSLDDKLSFVIQESEVYSKRWDFEYFEPKYTNTIQKIIQCHWPVKTLGEIVTTLTDGQHGYLNHLPNGIPLLRTTNIFENEIRLHDLRYIAPEVHAAIKRSQLKPGDVLLTTIGSIGIAAVVDDSLGEANINQNLVKLTPQADINPYYLALFLNSPIGRIQTERTASKSVVPIVNYTRLREVLIPIPPYSVQEHIAEVMQNSYTHIKHIRSDAENLVIEAKTCVERMILGEEEVT